MLYQYWIVENASPSLTNEQRIQYAPLVENRYEWDHVIEGREIVRYLTDPERMEVIIQLLTEGGRDPVIIGALDQSGNEFITRNFSEWEKYTQPIGGVATENNTSAGWVPFNFSND